MHSALKSSNSINIFQSAKLSCLLKILLVSSVILSGVWLYYSWKGEGWWGGGGELKGSSFWGTPTKKLQNLWPVASKVTILRLRHHQDRQVVIYIDTKLWTSKALISEKGEITNFILKECGYTVLSLSL